MTVNTPFLVSEAKEIALRMGVSIEAQAFRLFNFATGVHTLSFGQENALRQHVIPLVTKSPNLVVYLVGHASRLGNEASNQALSERRANEVAKFLQGSMANPDGRVFPIGRGETIARGKSENDPIDRAVVIVVQSVELPLPTFIADTESPTPQKTSQGPWRIKKLSTNTLTVPVPGGASVGAGINNLTLTDTGINKDFSYRLVGTQLEFNFSPPLLPLLEAILKRIPSFKGGPSEQGGTEIVMNPNLKPPFPPETFEGFVTVWELSTGIITGLSGNVVLFSDAPTVAGLILSFKGAGLLGKAVFTSGYKGSGFVASAKLSKPPFPTDKLPSSGSLRALTGR